MKVNFVVSVCMKHNIQTGAVLCICMGVHVPYAANNVGRVRPQPTLGVGAELGNSHFIKLCNLRNWRKK